MGAWEFHQVSHGGWKVEFSMGQEQGGTVEVALTGGAALLQHKGDWGQVPLHLWWHRTGIQDAQPQILYFKPLANSLESMKHSKTSVWLRQPYPTTELSCVTKTSQCHCRDCRSTFWFCSSWDFRCQHLLVSAKEIQATLLIKTLEPRAQFKSQLHILSGQYLPAKWSEEARGELTTDY